MEMKPDGVFLSNGPGDPSLCTETIEHLRWAITQDKPIMGICLGNQLLGLAAGATTYKLPYGHRAHNHPVIRCGSTQCYITSQNHGYAVIGGSIDPSIGRVSHINANGDLCSS